jgi:hypothetical protein
MWTLLLGLGLDLHRGVANPRDSGRSLAELCSDFGPESHAEFTRLTVYT